jgi:hypothetical protein
MAQSSIDFLLNNNVSIIQGIFAIIFILVVFVILRSFKKDSEDHVPPRPSTIRERREEEAKAVPPPPPPSDDSSPLDDLDNLDDLMGPEVSEASQEQINQTVSEPVTPPQPEVNIPPPSDFVEAAQSAPGASKAPPSNELTSALNEKEKVIADLRSEIKNLQEKAPAAGEPGDLQAKVKELTEKLSEYEIIEDDIANLSFYKTENTKLKNELEKLKGAAAANTEAAIEEINSKAAPVAREPAAPSAPEPAPAPVSPAPASATPAPADDSILNEFEEAVKQKEALEKSAVISESAPSSSVNSSESDLLNEFEKAVEKELTPAPAKESAPEPVTDINTDKLSEKLVQEVEALATSKPPETPDDGKDSNQKLIEEFENFVNKG